MDGGNGGWCGQSKAVVKKHRGEQARDGTCSPRVGITLAGACQACLRRRHISQPPQAIPASPITHVDGSGTATGLARRKPMLSLSFDGASGLLMEDDKENASSLFQ